MKLSEFIKTLIEAFKTKKEFQEVEEANKQCCINLIKANEQIGKLTTEIFETEQKVLDQEEQIKELSKPKISIIDTWCETEHKKIPNIAYQQKRKFESSYYSIFLNELITPGAFEVQKFKRNIPTTTSIMSTCKNIGNSVAKYLTWTSDKNLATSGDYYVTPSESLVYKKVDCEDHAYVCASLNEEIGVCMGFAIIGGEKFGHAFNCFIYHDDLYILDTVGNKADIVKYVEKECGYIIHYIITKNNTYQLKSGVDFGKIAGWD